MKQNRLFSLITGRLFVVVSLAVMAASMHASIGLQDAWRELKSEARPLLARGLPLKKVVEDAFLLDESEHLTVAATDLFTELFDALLTKISQTALPEAAQSIRALRAYLYNTILGSFVLRQKLALEVFHNYPRWNVGMSDSGLISSVDTDVFVSFIVSLKTTFSDLTNHGERFITGEQLELLGRLIDGVSRNFASNVVVAAAKGVKNLAKYSAKFALKTTGKALSVVGTGVKTLGKQVTAQRVKRAVLMTGAVSATALLLWGCYVFNHRKRLARSLFEAVGGMNEVKKKAVLMYVDPESKWERLTAWIRDYLYDNPEVRSEKASDLQTKLPNIFREGYTVPAGADPLTHALKTIARNERLVGPEHLEFVRKEMRDDVRYQQYKTQKARRDARLRQENRADFSKASSTYLGLMQPAQQKLSAARVSLENTLAGLKSFGGRLLSGIKRSDVVTGVPLQAPQIAQLVTPIYEHHDNAAIPVGVAAHDPYAPTAPPATMPYNGVVMGTPLS